MVRHILKICGGQENIENWLRFSQKLRAKRALLKSPQDGVNDFKLQSNTNAPNLIFFFADFSDLHILKWSLIHQCEFSRQK